MFVLDVCRIEVICKFAQTLTNKFPIIMVSAVSYVNTRIFCSARFVYKIKKQNHKKNYHNSLSIDFPSRQHLLTFWI